MNKLLSIVIPTYKGSESIFVALSSIARQSYKNIEVIVSDDNGKGTDDQIKTQKVIESFSNELNIKYLINSHVNGSHARNKGLEVAKGDYISLLDDDDFYLEEYAKEVISVFDNNKDVDFVFFDVAIITKEGVSRTVCNEKIDYKDFLLGNKEIGTGSNICFRRRALDDGGFDERYLRYQDIEFIVKKLYKFKSIWINRLLVVKYFNKIDNYLNYEKSLNMQKLLREDVYEKGIINNTEFNELESRQLHGLFNDMLAKGMNKKDINIIYKMLKDRNMLSFIDKGMCGVYMISKKAFKFVFDMFMSNKSKQYNVDFNKLLEYREMLEKGI